MTISETEAQDPLDELARENNVIQRLDDRLGEIGILLGNGVDVPPGEIAEGLRLFEQYVAIHSRRFDEGLQPEARPVAMATCFDHLDAISRDRAGTAQRVARMNAAISAYARGEGEGRTRLVKELEDFTQHEFEEVRYENDYPLSCLRATLPDDAAGRVLSSFNRTASEVDDLDRHVEQYLRHEPGKALHRFVVRCAQPGCIQKSEGESCPAENGHLGIRGPRGWKAVADPPRVADRQGKPVVVSIHYFCPAHSAGPADSAKTTPRTAALHSTPTTPGPDHSGSAGCSCCDPISPRLA